MRLDVCGCEAAVSHGGDFTLSVLSCLCRRFGVQGTITALRISAGLGAAAAVTFIALLMWTLPAAADAALGGATALSWTFWLQRQEGQ